LEEVTGSFAKSVPAHQRNLVTINQQVEALAAAGWELVQALSHLPTFVAVAELGCLPTWRSFSAETAEKQRYHPFSELI
jgi:hypothetical protein